MSVVAPEYLLPSTTASDQLGTLRNATALAELGCRAQMIQKLTSAGMPTIKAIIERAGGLVKDPGGRQPRSLPMILESVPRHVEASFFLKHYVSFMEFYGPNRGVIHSDVFIRALLYIRGKFREQLLTPDHAFMVASMYHSGEVVLKRCQTCSSSYMTSAAPVLIRSHLTSGECPLCRELASISKGRSVVKIPDARAQRALLKNFSNG